jgi:predicted RecB family nuclease
MSAQQCPKRLHLEVHRPELAEISSSTEIAFRIGREIGAIARLIYGTGDYVYLDYAAGLDEALRRTTQMMKEGPKVPVFEATFQYESVLVRVDVLIPDGDSWRLVEVKASTNVHDEHVVDCAIQDWVLKGLGHQLSSVAVAHVNRDFVYTEEGNYEGLLVEEGLSSEVAKLSTQVPALVNRARQAVQESEPSIAVGRHCTVPYTCPFFGHCWPSQSEYPVYGLGGGKQKLAAFVEEGYLDIRDVPAHRLTGAGHQRIHRVTVEGVPELLDGARDFTRQLPYPRYYLDFETIGPAIPIWLGTRPYERLAFQWSCHIESARGEMRHEDFLDLSGDPPMRALAEALVSCLGGQGPILTYTSYERGVLESLANRFTDLSSSLHGFVERLVDLHPVTKQNYYHPDMLGSWSLKAVLPTVAPSMKYSDLEGIQEGMGASAAYLEAIHQDTTDDRRQELEEQLLKYCRFDTEAMVQLVRFFETSGVQ